MRTFKVGDKVKFLNQVGGGVITKIVSPSLVNVEVDGFEIPTLTKEIVLDHVDDKAGKMFTSEGNINNDESKQAVYDEDNIEVAQEEDSYREHLYLSRKGQEKDKGVYLAFIPCDQQLMLSGEYYIYLVNNSDWTLLYSLFLEDKENNHFVGQDFGQVEAKERLLLATIDDKDLEKWTNGVIQILFHKDNTSKVLTPASYKIKIRTAKFFKEGCFEDTGLFTEKALLVPIALTDNVQPFADAEDMNLNSKKNQEKLKELQDKITGDEVSSKPIEVKSTQPVSFFDKHLINKKEAEVDLHIEELTDSVKNLSSSDMLNIQMEYFQKCLAKAIEMNLDKIVFIHGVGQGVLKHNIEEELDKYKFIHYFPSSMRKYGVGATEVVIGKNQS